MNNNTTRTNKSVSLAVRKVPMQHHDGHDAGLQLILENEIDKLALLTREVREQSARVQAAADAIGDKLLLNFAANIRQ